MIDRPLNDAWQSLRRQWPSLAAAGDCPFMMPPLKRLSEELGLPPLAEAPPQRPPCPLPQVEPALKNLDEQVLLGLQGLVRSDPNSPALQAWMEKLLRACELGRLELATRLAGRGLSRRQARRVVLWLCLLFLEDFDVSNDARLVNIVLKLMDQRWLQARRPGRLPPAPDRESWIALLRLLVHVLLAASLMRIARPDWTVPQNFSARQRLEKASALPMQPPAAWGPPPPVAVISPNPYSLYTLACLELLRVHGVPVSAVVVRKLMSVGRFVSEYRRDGKRLLRKIWQKLILKRRAYARRAYQSLPGYLRQIGLEHRHVQDWARRQHVPVYYCKTINDPPVIELLRQLRPAAVVFTGGGLIRESVLELSGRGVLNCHMGLLPPYRGMDVVEWPILEGQADHVGITVHLMARGVDEGDILVMHVAPREHTHDIRQLRERMEEMSPKAIVSAVLRLLSGQLQPLPQAVQDGRQYFVMHPRLRAIAIKKYRRILASSQGSVA